MPKRRLGRVVLSRSTMEGDEPHYTACLPGTPSLQAGGCSTQRILRLPGAWVVFCIFHLTMTMGRLLGDFFDHFLGVYFFRCLTHFLSVYFFFDLLCLSCSPGTMPRRADVPQRSETESNNPAAQKFNNDFHEQAAIMPRAKENGDALEVATFALDTYEQGATTGKDSGTGTASDRESNQLTDSIDSLGLSADPTTTARSDETPWLDYHVPTLRAASGWMGYNSLIEDRPGDMREPQRVEYKAEKTIPNRAEDTKAAAVRKGKAVARYRLTTTPVLAGDLPDGQVYDPALSRDVNANSGRLNHDTAKVRIFPESVTAHNTETLKYQETGADPLIKDTCGSASYYAADARRSDALRPERG